jgi:hypothetical protein
MRAMNLTPTYEADLRARNAAARAEVEAETARAREQGARSEPAGKPDREAQLWNMGGHYAMIFVIWVLMLSAVVGAIIVVTS